MVSRYGWQLGNSADKLRHPRSIPYSVEHVHQIPGGGACLHCYWPLHGAGCVV